METAETIEDQDLAETRCSTIEYEFDYNVAQEIDALLIDKSWRRSSDSFLSPETSKLKSLVRTSDTFSSDELNELTEITSKIDWFKNDVYALGCSLFRCIFQIYPYLGTTPSNNDPLYKFIHRKNYKEFWNYEPLQPVL